MRLKDKIAVITGAGRGIGRDIALAYAQEGAHVVINDIDAQTAADTAKEAAAFGSNSLAVAADIAKSADIVRLIDTTVKERGRVDIVVNNAMKIVPGKLEALPEEAGHHHEYRAEGRLPGQPGRRQTHDRAKVGRVRQHRLGRRAVSL